MSIVQFPSWTFGSIQQTARNISGQLSPNELTPTQLAFYINNYYVYDLPRELKLEEQYVQYQFPLNPGVATYTLPSIYTHTENPIYVNGVWCSYTESPAVFYQQIPNLINEMQLGTTDGTSTIYTSPQIQSLVPTPIQAGVPNSVIITDTINTFSDDGQGNLICNNPGNSGTVVYSTGVVTLTYAVAPLQGNNITATFNYWAEGWPTSCLFFARQFTFYPVPDPNTAYQARIVAYQQSVVYPNGVYSTLPSELQSHFINNGDTPQKLEWGELIAIGAALKILRDFGQDEKYQQTLAYYRTERSKVMSDTDNQLINDRSMPRF